MLACWLVNMEISCGISSFISLKLLYIFEKVIKNCTNLAFKFLSKYKRNNRNRR